MDSASAPATEKTPPMTEKLKDLPADTREAGHCDDASSSTLPLHRQRKGKEIMQDGPEAEVGVVRVNIDTSITYL